MYFYKTGMGTRLEGTVGVHICAPTKESLPLPKGESGRVLECSLCWKHQQCLSIFVYVKVSPRKLNLPEFSWNLKFEPGSSSLMFSAPTTHSKKV